MEVDPTVVPELLEESLADRGIAGSNVVPVAKGMPRSRLDHISRSELKVKGEKA